MLKALLRKHLSTGMTSDRLAAGYVEGVWERSSGTCVPVWNNNRQPCTWSTIVHDGTLASLPAAANCPLNSIAFISEPAATGLTTPPTSTKMSRIKLINSYLVDGTTKAWRPDGTQTIFARGGVAATPIISVTLGGATGTLGDLFTMPASLLALADTVFEYDLIVARTTGATGTPAVGLVASGSAQPIGIASFATNANSLARVEGKMFVRTATSEFTTYNTPGAGAANSKTSGINGAALTLTAAQTFSVQIVSGGTSTEAFALCGVILKMSAA